MEPCDDSYYKFSHRWWRRNPAVANGRWQEMPPDFTPPEDPAPAKTHDWLDAILMLAALIVAIYLKSNL